MTALLAVVRRREAGDIALRGGDRAVSLIWDVFGPGAHRELSNLLESHGYAYQPAGGNHLPGGVVVYGDVRPIAEESCNTGAPSPSTSETSTSSLPGSPQR